MNDTYIEAFLGGGRTGTYDVRVWDNEWGYSNTSGAADNFKYQIEVSSVTPVNGSMFGGTLLTIVGINFKVGDT